jgi:hypothetical protein
MCMHMYMLTCCNEAHSFAAKRDGRCSTALFGSRWQQRVAGSRLDVSCVPEGVMLPAHMCCLANKLDMVMYVCCCHKVEKQSRHSYTDGAWAPES